MKSNLFEDLLHQELRSLYSTEKQMLKALTKMSGAAHHPKLQALFSSRMEEKAGQIKRLEEMAALLGRRLGASKCLSMKQLIHESESLILADADSATYDASLIDAVQHFVGYEIEESCMALALACRLGLNEVEVLLQKNLLEEKAASARLCKVAKALQPERGETDDSARADAACFMSCSSSMLLA